MELEEREAILTLPPRSISRARCSRWQGVVLGIGLTLTLVLLLRSPISVRSGFLRGALGLSAATQTFIVKSKPDTSGRALYDFPKHYGHVQEKTIWSYWHHPISCPSSRRCTLPAHIKLCLDSVAKNLGSFQHRILHMDEVPDYVIMGVEMPKDWYTLAPQLQKDSLMNALLARYGGVALDISTILLRPLDDMWDEMVQSRASFRGYQYRLNGQAWPMASSTPVWFLMSRREGVLRTAATIQAARDYWYETDLPYSTYGDYILTPVLSMFNYSLPKCGNDSTVPDRKNCPEFHAPDWSQGLSGPARNDMTLMLEDPRDGPISPITRPNAVVGGVSMWNITDSHEDKTMYPCRVNACCSPRECWENVFLEPFNTPAKNKAHSINFVKLFGHGYAMEDLSREDILLRRDSFFVNWLRIAGVDVSITAS